MATVPDTPAAREPNEEVDASSSEPSYPETWLWEEHGDVCSGMFVRFDKAGTREFGKKLILVLEVDGHERSIWLLQTALFNQVREELAERPERRLTPGERIAIHRLAATTTQDGKRSYRPFRIYFPDRPALDVAAEFGLDKPAAHQESESIAEATGPAHGVDADIPF